MDFSRLAPPWQACVEEAWEAFRAGSLAIGSAITAPDGAIAARGRNELFDREGDGFHLGGRLGHAELNALIALTRRVANPVGYALYTTTEPCPLCVGAIRMSRIGEVHYASHDPAAGSVELLTATPFMLRGRVSVRRPSDAALEGVLHALYIASHLRHARFAAAAEQLIALAPQAARLAGTLRAEKTLERMALAAAPASEMYDYAAAIQAELMPLAAVA